MGEVRLFALDGTPVALLAEATDVAFTAELEGLGLGSFSVPAGAQVLRSSPGLFAARRIVQVTDGGVRWQWLLEGAREEWRKLVAGERTGDPLPLSGDGLLALLAYTPVLPKGGLTTRPIDERVFGPMSPEYDDSFWDDVVQFALWREQSFSSGIMAEEFPFPLAGIISASLDNLPPGYYWFRHEFTVATSGLYTAAVAGDDNVLEAWIGEEELEEVATSGEHQWRSWQSDDIYLEADDPQVALFLVFNDDRTAATGDPDSLVRLVYGLGLTADDGKPLATNEVHEILVSATDGTYAILVNGERTADVAPGASSSTLQTLVEALPSIEPGDVEVAGSGDHATNQVTSLWVEATGGTFPILVDGVSAGQQAYGAAAATIEAAIESLPNVDGCTVVGGGTAEEDPYRIAFDGPTSQQTSFSVTSDPANLSGADPAVHISSVTNASEEDPYTVELTGRYASAGVLLEVDPSNLTGGTATTRIAQLGGAGRAFDYTRVKGWKVLANPAEAPGLTPHQVVATIVGEGVTYGSLPAGGVVLTSTVEADSGGVPWEARINWRFPTFDTSLLDVLQQLREMAKVAHVLLELVDGELTLSMWQDRGEDRSDGEAPVRFAEGLNLLDATYRHHEPETTDVYARHRAGWANASMLDEEPLKLGRAAIVSGATTGRDLVNFLAHMLERGARTFAAELGVVDTDNVAAGTDWWLGDQVLAPDRHGTMRRHRIWTVSPAGEHEGRRRWKVTVVLDEGA